MRATDSDNALLILAARELAAERREAYLALDRANNRLIDLVEAAHDKSGKFHRNWREKERWTLQQELYVLRLETRRLDRALLNARCNLERRLELSTHDVLELIGA